MTIQENPSNGGRNTAETTKTIFWSHTLLSSVDNIIQHMLSFALTAYIIAAHVPVFCHEVF
jgi:hypothetical protein